MNRLFGRSGKSSSSTARDSGATQLTGDDLADLSNPLISAQSNDYNNIPINNIVDNTTYTGTMAGADDGTVCEGRPVGPAVGMSIDSPTPTTVVTGRVLVTPMSSSTAMFGPTKQVCCAACNANNMVDSAVTRLHCGGCGKLIEAGSVPAIHCVCFSCNTPNLVQPDVPRIKCGNCGVMMDVPGAQADLRRAQLAAEEEEEIRKAIQLSLKEQ